MKRIISIFIVVMIIGTMFVGCSDKKEVAVESDGFIKPIVNETILVEEIIVEDIITEEIIVEDIID